MHAKPDLRVFLKWMIAGSGSVITDVIPLGMSFTYARTKPNSISAGNANRDAMDGIVAVGE